jgi:hypothetical protein
MSIELPKLIAIDHDAYHAEHIGRTRDGLQFFLTNPFVPASSNDPGREFVALYIFDAKGNLIEAKIDDFGPRKSMDKVAAERIYTTRLEELGDISYERIDIAPFSLERFGVTFGLLPDVDEEGVLSMILEPGNYMAFYEPWDSGDFVT